jgi:hypothetical protein
MPNRTECILLVSVMMAALWKIPPCSPSAHQTQARSLCWSGAARLLPQAASARPVAACKGGVQLPAGRGHELHASQDVHQVRLGHVSLRRTQPAQNEINAGLRRHRPPFLRPSAASGSALPSSTRRCLRNGWAGFNIGYGPHVQFCMPNRTECILLISTAQQMMHKWTD